MIVTNVPGAGRNARLIDLRVLERNDDKSRVLIRFDGDNGANRQLPVQNLVFEISLGSGRPEVFATQAYVASDWQAAGVGG
jgi:hypothetical protein